MNTENAFDVNHEQVYPNGGEFPEDTSSNANVDANTTNGTETNTAIERTAVTTTASSSIDVDMKNTLPDDNIEDRKKKDKPEVVSFTSLFRFAKAIDIFYMLIGTIAALANGGGFPLMLLLFGNMTDVFTNRSFDLCTFNFTALDQFCPPGVKLTAQNFLNEYKKCNFSGSNFTIPENDFSTKIREQAVWFVIIGGATMIIGYFQVAFWSMACERQTRRLREVLFRAILNKEISYFDINKTGELNTRLTEDVNKVHDGIGDKISSALQFFSTFIGGMALGFIKGWKLTLVVLSVSPVLFGGAVILTRIIATTTSKELKSYAKAGAVAEEVFSSIRTVFAYNGATYESDRYKQHLRTVKINGIRKGATTGAFLGFLFLIIFCAYALGFWYGAKLVRDEKYSIGDILTIFFSIITAVFSLGQAAPHLQAMAQARGAAYTLWFIIDTPSKITSDSESGIKADDLIGDIQFTNVNFVYPSRPDVSVLNGLSFTAQQGETIALVGTSGCGKSTCMQLLQRFYDPISGSVMIGDHRVDEYHLGWLRQRIGVVSQEPILFQATIAENILLGRPEATQQEIEDAARIANAHDFIMTLPQKYDTPVGERGAQMSGGQKQRIAIARALIRDPRILLLDEATSALDTESERIVQDALNTASKGRTTIVIAHRLSTIVNASKIIVIDKGTVIEEGNHHSLMELKGNYYGLVEAQNLRMNKTDETELENENEDDLIVDKQDNRTSSLDEDARHAAATTFEERPDGQAEVQDDKNVKGSGRSPFFTMLRMNKPEWCYIMFGCIACICNGGVQPAFGLILSKVIAVFQECDLHEREKRVNFYVILFAGFGVLMLITMFLQTFLFTISGEALTQRLRTKIFRLLLRQEVAYFDKPENSTGALCTRLSTEASAVQGATGIRIGTMLQNFANLGVGIVLAFFYGWQLTLVVLAFVPFMIISGFLQTYLLTGFANKDKKALEEAGKIAIESISNIRTVAQLVKEPYFGDEYCKLLDVPLRNSLRRAHIFAILFSFTNSIMFYAQAALFIFGGWMVDRGSMTFENVMLVLNCLLFGAMAVGQTASLSPDYAKAIDASKRILALFDRTPEIDNGATDGDVLENFKGEIDFVDLQFRYPNRAELSVLKRFNLNIKPHQQVALVGASGCGKSTTIQLIERFYNPTNGQLLVDHHDVSTLNLQWWRSKIGFVSQEPVLFDASIRENIAYGDTSRYVPMAEICEAAKNANIHRFIETLPEQYETNVGAKGTQLSGGEKQRIAIARALIRNPSILLLDEATSALDTESERIVQDALDRASKGRTTIVIAHRLSTIQNSDVICVIHRGRIVEQGVHDDLLAKKGFYYRLAQAKK